MAARMPSARRLAAPLPSIAPALSDRTASITACRLGPAARFSPGRLHSILGHRCRGGHSGRRNLHGLPAGDLHPHVREPLQDFWKIPVPVAKQLHAGRHEDCRPSSAGDAKTPGGDRRPALRRFASGPVQGYPSHAPGQRPRATSLRLVRRSGARGAGLSATLERHRKTTIDRLAALRPAVCTSARVGW